MDLVKILDGIKVLAGGEYGDIEVIHTHGKNSSVISLIDKNVGTDKIYSVTGLTDVLTRFDNSGSHVLFIVVLDVGCRMPVTVHADD